MHIKNTVDDWSKFIIVRIAKATELINCYNFWIWNIVNILNSGKISKVFKLCQINWKRPI
jgi:hypothetical protein